MPYYAIINVLNLPGICRLCSSPMCFVETDDDLWWHCHDCDMRICDEETH